MKYKSIELSNLLVNQANDRHGELLSEEMAIEWLLTHRATHMRSLTKDIVKTREIYEPPLIREEGEKFVVYDGNRRTTSLKLLNEPQKAPSSDWANFFSDQRAKWVGDFPKTITCQIEQDRERLDEILYRRHTGQQNGIGQSQWDAPAKTNFERRTGKNTKLDLAEAVETLLKEHDFLESSQKIPRSNFKRLFSAEQFRNRTGISIEKNKLVLTHKRHKVLSALNRIANDLISKTVTLDDIWDNTAKRAYLDKLDKQGVLPTVEDAVPRTDTKSEKQPKAKKAKKKSQPKAKRRTLIRNIDHGLVVTHKNRKALDIFEELQHRLKFEQHDNAIAVLFRVLLEISIDLYIAEWNVIDTNKNEKLAGKFRKSLASMLTHSSIDKKQHDTIKKFEKNEALFSTNTLHSYVHSSDFFPSDHHLKTMWDNLETFVIICLNPRN